MADSTTTEFSDGIPPYITKRPLPKPVEETLQTSGEKKGITRFLPHAFVAAISAGLLALGIHDLNKNQASSISTPQTPAPTAEKGNNSPLSADATSVKIIAENNPNFFTPPPGRLEPTDPTTPAQRVQREEIQHGIAHEPPEVK